MSRNTKTVFVAYQAGTKRDERSRFERIIGEGFSFEAVADQCNGRKATVYKYDVTENNIAVDGRTMKSETIYDNEVLVGRIPAAV